MNNEIQKFDFKAAVLRTLTDEEGEPWFVAKDVCDILGMSNPSMAVIALDKDEVAQIDPKDYLGSENRSNQAVNIVSEPGLYKLIMRSRKPEAKEFQRWVTHEVLPQIRKTGGYIPTSESDSDEDIMARAVLVAQKTIERKNQQLQAKDAQIKVLEPKARFADAVAASDGTCLVGELAKMLRQNGMDIGQNRLSSSGRRVSRQIRLQPQRANTACDGLGIVPYQGDHRHPCGRAYHGQSHSEGHGQGAALFHRSVPGSHPAVVGSGCVMSVSQFACLSGQLLCVIVLLCAILLKLLTVVKVLHDILCAIRSAQTQIELSPLARNRGEFWTRARSLFSRGR